MTPRMAPNSPKISSALEALSMDEHIRAFEVLPEPTKSLAINFAESGSLPDIAALHEHILLTTTSLAARPCYHIVATIFHFLGAQALPDDLSEVTEETKEETKNLVFWVRLSLEIISHTALRLEQNDQRYFELANYILTQHDHIFPWLDFCQAHYFGHSNPMVADDERRMAFSLAGILGTVVRVHHLLDRNLHSSLGKMVIHIWHKLLHMDSIYPEANVDMQTIVLAVDRILPMYLQLDTVTNESPRHIMDVVGGPSAVIAFTLAHMERDILYIGPQLNGVDLPFAGIRGGFANLASFIPSPVHIHEILEQRVITRLVNILRQVMERGPPPAPGPTSNPPTISEQAVLDCLTLMVSCLRLGPAAVGEMLDSGLTDLLRAKRLPSQIPPTHDGLQSIELLPFIITNNFFYPSVIKRSKKQPTTTRPIGRCFLPQIWSMYDVYVIAYGYLWDRAGNIARMLDKCTTCKVSGSDRNLKVCANCHVTKYCSPECQRTSWEGGHRVNCLMLRCSHYGRRATTISCRDFLYLALVEHFLLQGSTARSEIDAAITSIRRLPLSDKDEIPVLMTSVGPRQPKVNIVRMKEFPEIFGTSEWRRSLLPRFRQLFSTGRIKHLTVMGLPSGFEAQSILGALTSTVASGMVDRTTWDREAAHFESIRPRIWPNRIGRFGP